MEGILAILLIFGGIPATIILIYVASRRHKERMEMISKGVNQSLFIEPPDPKTGNSTLLFGLFAVAIGLAFTISSIFIMENFDRDMMTVAMVFLLGGGSLLLYWRLTAKDREFARRIHQEHLTRIAEEYSPSGDQEEKSEDQ